MGHCVVLLILLGIGYVYIAPVREKVFNSWGASLKQRAQQVKVIETQRKKDMKLDKSIEHHRKNYEEVAAQVVEKQRRTNENVECEIEKRRKKDEKVAAQEIDKQRKNSENVKRDIEKRRKKYEKAAERDRRTTQGRRK